MVTKTPHCVGHKKYIPSCKVCNALKKQWLANKPTNKTDVIISKDKMPRDKEGKPLLTRKYERLTFTYEMIEKAATMFNDMDEVGYEFFTQVNHIGKFPTLIFKKKE